MNEGQVKIMWNFDDVLSIYSTMIAPVLRGYSAAFLCHCILRGPVDKQIWANLTKYQSRG